MDIVLLFLIFIIISVLFIIKFSGLTSVIKFAYPNAKYNAMGNPYVREDKLDSLLDLKNLHEFINVLEKEYNFKEEKDVEDIENSLIKSRNASFQGIINDSPKPIKKFFDIYFQKYELEIIKSIFLSKLDNEEMETFHPLGMISEEFLYNVKDIKNTQDVLDLLKEIKYFNNPEIYLQLNELFEKYDNNFLEIDTVLDKYYYKNLKNIEKKIMRGFSKPFKIIINMQIDLTNINILLRAKQSNFKIETFEKLIIGQGRNIAEWKLKQLFLSENINSVIEGLNDSPYYEILKSANTDFEKSNDIFVYEKAIDSYILNTSKEFSFRHVLTSGPLLRFLISKEFEIRNLRTTARGIQEKINKNTIKKLLIIEEAL